MSKSGTLIAGAILAAIVVGIFLPPPNVIGGGTAVMCIYIFLTVGFKMIIDIILSRRRKSMANKGKRDGDGN